MNFWYNQQSTGCIVFKNRKFRFFQIQTEWVEKVKVYIVGRVQNIYEGAEDFCRRWKGWKRGNFFRKELKIKKVREKIEKRGKIFKVKLKTSLKKESGKF